MNWLHKELKAVIELHEARHRYGALLLFNYYEADDNYRLICRYEALIKYLSKQIAKAEEAA